MSRADLNRHFSVEPFEKIEQLAHGEAAEMPVHQARHVRLRAMPKTLFRDHVRAGNVLVQSSEENTVCAG